MNISDLDFVKLLQSGVVILGYIILRFLFRALVRKRIAQKLFKHDRGERVRKGLLIVLNLFTLILLLLIWGVKQQDLALFIGSVLTFLGVAFFAQWSLLSNATSGIILFFNSNVKLGDHIQLLEGKDYLIEGTIEDIGLFFITLRSLEGEDIFLPNNVFIVKVVKKVKE